MVDIDAFIDHTATLKRPLPKIKQDATGGVVRDNYAQVDAYADLPCCIRPIAARYQMQYASRNVTVTHRVYFDRVYPVKAQDVLDTDHGKRLLVKGLFDTDELGELFVVDCEEQLRGT